MADLSSPTRQQLRVLSACVLICTAVCAVDSNADDNYITAVEVKPGKSAPQADPAKDLFTPLTEADKAIGNSSEPTAEIAQPADPPAAVENADEEDREDVVRERFPSGAVKIERHLTQDADGNFLNHGAWTQWDEKGRLVARGEYRQGERHGKWFRRYDAKQASLFSEPANRGFELPYGTEAEFVDGKIHGTWVVFDARKRKICAWEFDAGQRQGRSVWYSPNGQIRQEVLFKNGQMDGDLRQLNADGKLVAVQTYIEGRRLATETKYHAPGKKKSEGPILYAATYTDVMYDWWTGSGEVVPPSKEQTNQRHGLWTWWYSNGKKQLEGRYENDLSVGDFRWWYANGQRQLRGDYVNGLQHGKFVWWFESGQKHREGKYNLGVPVDNWMEWTLDGRIVQTEDYRARGNATVESTAPEKLPAPQLLEEQTPIRMGAKKRVQF